MPTIGNLFAPRSLLDAFNRRQRGSLAKANEVRRSEWETARSERDDVRHDASARPGPARPPRRLGSLSFKLPRNADDSPREW
jgi:hypothetical protein